MNRDWKNLATWDNDTPPELSPDSNASDSPQDGECGLKCCWAIFVGYGPIVTLCLGDSTIACLPFQRQEFVVATGSGSVCPPRQTHNLLHTKGRFITNLSCWSRSPTTDFTWSHLIHTTMLLSAIHYTVKNSLSKKLMLFTMETKSPCVPPDLQCTHD